MNNRYEINEIENYLNISGNKAKNTELKEISKHNNTESNIENNTISIDKKVYLTIKETSLLFNIGITKIRNLTQEKNCPFVLFNGTKCLISRKKFEIFLDNKHSI